MVCCGEGGEEWISLQRDLGGKCWNEVSPLGLIDGANSFPLLRPDAKVAFLPAWLLGSRESFRRDSEVLEFTVYCLCPGGVRSNARGRWITVWRVDAIAKTNSSAESWRPAN